MGHPKTFFIKMSEVFFYLIVGRSKLLEVALMKPTKSSILEPVINPAKE